MSTKNILLSLAALILGFSACQHNTPKVEQDSEISYEHVAYVDTCTIQTESYPLEYYWDFDLQLPEAGQGEAIDTIRRQLIAMLFSAEGLEVGTLDAKLALSHYVKHNQHIVAQEDFGGVPIRSQMSHLKPFSISDTTLTFLLEFDIYLGGAHGNYAITYFVFDRRTGHLVTDDDIWRADTQAQADQLLLDALQRYIDASPESLTLDDFWVEYLHPNNNFYLTPDTIYYTFNIYDIAAYCNGFQTLGIPLAQARPYMK